MLVPLTSRQTVDLASVALSSGRGAGLPELLELIQTLTGRIDHVSLNELGDLIEQDPVVAARLISMANMIGLNPGMTSLSSVTHAIHQIGFQRVRGLAISLLLLKSSGSQQYAAEQRQAASRALCAGLISHACARQVSAVDPDLVFACATLRQLGRILLPVVSVEHYRAAVTLAETQPEPAAFREYFSLTPLELSRELLKGYSLPREVQDALADCPAPGTAASAYSERMIGLAEYGSKLTELVLDVSLGREEYDHAATQLAGNFAGVIPHLNELLPVTLDFAGERLAQFAQMPGASTFPEIMVRRIRSRLPRPEEAEAPVAAPLEVAETPAPRAPVPLFSTAPFPVPARPPEIAANAPEVPAAAATAPGADPTPDSLPDAITLMPEPVRAGSVANPWLQVLRPVCDGFGARECAVFLRSALQGPFVLAEGLGRFAAHNLDLAAVHPADRNVFSIALMRREAVVIHNARTPSLQGYLPPWFKLDPETPGAFLLVPLTCRDRVEGLVLIGWAQPRQIEMNASHAAMLNLLRNTAESLLHQRSEALRAKAG